MDFYALKSYSALIIKIQIKSSDFLKKFIRNLNLHCSTKKSFATFTGNCPKIFF